MVKNTIFAEKTFADCSLCCVKERHGPNFVEKTFANSHKIVKFAKVFSLESFPLYCKTPRLTLCKPTAWNWAGNEATNV